MTTFGMVDTEVTKMENEDRLSCAHENLLASSMPGHFVCRDCKTRLVSDDDGNPVELKLEVIQYTGVSVDVKNAEVVPRNNYVDTLRQITEAGFCPFCEEHLFKHHRQPLLFRTWHWLVTKNAWPYDGTCHHFLLIALKHIERTEDLSVEAWADFQQAYARLVNEYELTGAALLMRSGETSVTGATVSHLHAQIIIGIPRGEATEPIRAVVGFKQK